MSGYILTTWIVSRGIGSQRLGQGLGWHCLTLVQLGDGRLDDGLCLILPEAGDKAVVEMFSCERPIDFRLPIMVVQLGKIDHPIPTAICGLTVDLEHNPIRCERHETLQKQVLSPERFSLSALST